MGLGGGGVGGGGGGLVRPDLTHLAAIDLSFNCQVYRIL